MLEEKQKERS